MMRKFKMKFLMYNKHIRFIIESQVVTFMITLIVMGRGPPELSVNQSITIIITERSLPLYLIKTGA